MRNELLPGYREPRPDKKGSSNATAFLLNSEMMSCDSDPAGSLAGPFVAGLITVPVALGLFAVLRVFAALGILFWE